MSRAKVLASSLPAFLVACALAGPADAQLTIQRGVDLFSSQAGTLVDFSKDPLPTNFFGCGEKFSGTISFVGRPILADKPIGNTDTIIQRPNNIPLVGGVGSGAIRIVALSLRNAAWTDPCGRTWKVTARLDQAAAQPGGTITITQTSATGGTFSSSMTVLGEVSWTDGAATLGPVANAVTLASNGSCWATSPGAGGLTVTAPLTVDSDGDGVLDRQLLGTSNFHPGWCGPNWTPIPHDGPHPVGGGKRCQQYKTGQVPVELEPPGATTSTTGYVCRDTVAAQ
jgi:hypothetical protein